MLGHTEDRRDVWLLCGCPNPACRRGVLIRVTRARPWEAFETSDDGLLLSGACVLPRPG